MKPQRSNPYIETAYRDKANSIAPVIESAIGNFAQSHYEFKTVVERYTDHIWYCKEKNSGATLFHVSLEYSDSDAGAYYGLKKGLYHTRVHFISAKDPDTIPPIEQKYELTKLLESTTGLVSLYMGKYGVDRD
jgi:hypothetical protein